MRETLTSVVIPDISRVIEAPATLVITLVIVVILVKDQEKGVTRAIVLTGAKSSKKNIQIRKLPG